MTFGIVIDAASTLEPREPKNHRLGWDFWGRTYANWHARWAARGARTNAGSKQYGQKTVWVLEHRYTEPGLRASLLKGRDRGLAGLILDDIHDEARYLGWLQIRDVGSARTLEGMLWSDEDRPHRDRDEVGGYEPPPDSLIERDEYWYEDDFTIRRMRHRQTHARSTPCCVSTRANSFPTSSTVSTQPSPKPLKTKSIPTRSTDKNPSRRTHRTLTGFRKRGQFL